MNKNNNERNNNNNDEIECTISKFILHHNPGEFYAGDNEKTNLTHSTRNHIMKVSKFQKRIEKHCNPNSNLLTPLCVLLANTSNETTKYGFTAAVNELYESLDLFKTLKKDQSSYQQNWIQ